MSARDTFISHEGVNYLKAYLKMRQRGSPRGHIPPETLHDNSPLIRNARSTTPKPITSGQIYRVVNELFIKAGITRAKRGRLYNIRPHSIRKFFRTQLAALGVDRDYIEYMMGHKISVYHDVQMKGIDYLRNIYAAANLAIQPKLKTRARAALAVIPKPNLSNACSHNPIAPSMTAQPTN